MHDGKAVLGATQQIGDASVHCILICRESERERERGRERERQLQKARRRRNPGKPAICTRSKCEGYHGVVLARPTSGS